MHLICSCTAVCTEFAETSQQHYPEHILFLQWCAPPLLVSLQHCAHEVHQDAIYCSLYRDDPGKPPLGRPGELVLGECIAPRRRFTQCRNVGRGQVEECEDHEWLEAQRWHTEVLGVDD